MLVVDGDALAYLREGAEVLVFDLADAAKALAQFEHSSKVVAFDFVGSQQAIGQFEQAMEVEEAFLVHCLCLCMDCFAAAFGRAVAAMFPSNMVDVGLRQMVPLVVGGYHTKACNIPPQPKTPSGTT